MGYITAYLLYTGFAAGITSILVGKDIQHQISVDVLRKEKASVFSVYQLKADLPRDFINRVRSALRVFVPACVLVFF